MEGDTYAPVDNVSVDAAENRIKYIDHIAQVMKWLYHESGEISEIRMIAIYTGDVKRAEGLFQTDCVTSSMEQAFVSQFPAEEIHQTSKRKLWIWRKPYRTGGDAADHTASC